MIRQKNLYKDYKIRKKKVSKQLSLVFWRAIKSFYQKGYLTMRRATSKIDSAGGFRSVKNFCYLSGRGRSIVSSLRLSRHMARHFGNHGLLFSFKKSSF